MPFKITVTTDDLIPVGATLRRTEDFKLRAMAQQSSCTVGDYCWV